MHVEVCGLCCAGFALHWPGHCSRSASPAPRGKSCPTPTLHRLPGIRYHLPGSSFPGFQCFLSGNFPGSFFPLPKLIYHGHISITDKRTILSCNLLIYMSASLTSCIRLHLIDINDVWVLAGQKSLCRLCTCSRCLCARAKAPLKAHSTRSAFSYPLLLRRRR